VGTLQGAGGSLEFGLSHQRIGDAEPRQHLGHDGGVLGGALGQGEGNLGPIDGDGERDHTAVLGHPDAVTNNATNSRVDRSWASSSARACSVRATNRRETADLEVPAAARSTSVPTGSSPTR
jgi:hypothetical protein